MALIELKTNLKSLKFKGDLPGGGTSNQPYIKKDIEKKVENSQSGINGGNDFLLRGGTLSAVRSAEDVSRITQFFIDTKSFKGTAFTLKQNLLSKSSTDIRAGSPNSILTPFTINQGIYTPLSTITQAGVVAFGNHVNKNGLNPLNGTLSKITDWISDKLNINEGNFSPVSLPIYSKIYNNIGVKDIKDDKSRLLYLSEKHGYLSTKTTNDAFGNVSDYKNKLNNLNVVKDASKLLNKVKKIFSPDNVILDYYGGPGSVLGVGKTSIHFSTLNKSNSLKLEKETWTPKNDTSNYTPLNRLSASYIKGEKDTYRKYNELYKDSYIDKNNFIIKKGLEKNEIKNSKSNTNNANTAGDNQTKSSSSSYIEMNDVNSIYKSDNKKSEIAQTPEVVDFRNLKDGNFTPWNGVLDMYAVKESNGHGRIFMNDPTHRRKGKSDDDGDLKYNFTNTNYIVDEINASGKFENRNKFDDLVKLRIGVWDRISGKWEYIQFRAFIDNFSDSYSSEWDSMSFMGRGEKFQKYKGFNRDISLDFTVAALSSPELIPMYKKLNFLASTLAPNYGNNGYMSGTIISLTVGGYIYEVPGTLSSITLSPPQESPWEIGVSYKGKYDDKVGSYEQRNSSWDHSVKELPMIMKVTGFKFTPIHNFVPQIQSNYENGEVRFISLDNGSNNNYSIYSEA